ncbi:hypothetical protein BSPLISOX_1603 [uncultured Gammaproteobacteria bacterium]|nr:hypothetical protein BSPLISOX_1603 [uncultured Gammaproteobacteria bacterium]
MEAQVRPLIVVIPRFIQLEVPLPPLKPMAQSRCGVMRIMEVQAHPLVKDILRFIQILAPLPPLKPMGPS